MATRQSASEQKKALAKARLAKFREKVKTNPELLEDYKRKEREKYQKRKQNGKIKKTEDLTNKQHEQKKKQWRENSKRYYRRKKQLKAVLDVTPSEEDDTLPQEAEEVIQNLEEDAASPREQPPQQVNLTPQRKETSLQILGLSKTSTPKESPKKRRRRIRKIISELRSKLQYTKQKLLKRTKEMTNLKKTLKRREMMSKRKQVIVHMGGRKVQEKTTKKGERTLPNNSQRRLMRILVSRFLHQDDVSEIINGKSGEIRKNGQIFRKRALTDTMANLHQRFLSENPRHKLSKAQFFKLKPFWIGQRRVKDRETCACKTHENFGLKIKKLHQLGVIETSSPRDTVQTSVCCEDDMSCMYKTCHNCKQKTFPTTLDPSTKGNIIVWEEWVSRTVPIAKKCKDGSIEEKEVRNVFLEKRHTSIEKLVDLTQEHLPIFSRHIYNIKHQFQRLGRLRETLTHNDVVVHIDYSENYACKYSREIKETHFGGGNQQVTLHTGVIYTGAGKVESFASLSACLQHDATATWAHLDPVLRSIREAHPNTKNIHFISDGPTSQYRNKTNFYLASTVPFVRGFNYVTWNFTEASHGKGAPDGVGGALKNLADRIVSYGTSIPNADTLFEQLNLNSSVRLFKITEEDIKTSGEFVPPYLKTIPGTMRIHQLTSTKPGLIRTREVSCFCDFACGCFSPKEFDFHVNVESDKDHTEPDKDNAEPVLEVGKWVLVEYDGELFPGTITQIVDGQYEVDTMSCAGANKFYIPSMRFEGEKVWYYFDNIKAVIPDPQPVTYSARHFCVLPEIWAKYTKNV